MSKKIIILLLSILTLNCALENSQNKKIVNFSSGKTGEVFFEKQTSPENEPILIVDYRTDEQIIREETVETEVLEIWKEVRDEADKLELNEAVIRYKFFGEEKIENGRSVKLYTGLLFTAEKRENGSWKIDKLN